jgi:DNA polymerase-4
MAAPTDDGGAIYAAARAQLERLELDRPVRLTGVSVSGLDDTAARQLPLFGRPDPRRKRLHEAVDDLARRYGKGAVRPATLAGEGDDGEGR